MTPSRRGTGPQRGIKMFATDSVTIKLFGKKITSYRLLKDGEVVQVFETKKEAEAAKAAAA